MAISEAIASGDITTSSGTDVLMTSMTLTPGAGDYLAVFSTSVHNDTAGALVRCSLYVNSVQQAHTEREILAEGSLLPPGFQHLLATNAHLSVGAGEDVEVHWHVSAGTGTAGRRTLNLFPISASDVEASAVDNPTTSSGTDVLLTSMTLTPGAGDYLAIFSTSADGPAGSQLAFSLYVGGVQVPHTERFIDQETSIPNTEMVVFIAAEVNPTAGQDVEVQWRRSAGSGTITAHERTLTLFQTPTANIFEASATGTTTSTSTTDEAINSMTQTPGAAEYLALFSSSFTWGALGSDADINTSIYDNAVQVTDTERLITQNASVDSAGMCHATHGIVSPGAGQAVDVRWRSNLTDTRTAHERTLVLVKEAAHTGPLVNAGRLRSKVGGGLV